MENTRQQDLQTVEPAVTAPAQAAIEKQHFKQVQAKQDDACGIDQQIEGQGLWHQLIEQHHPPESDRQDLAQAQDELHTTPLWICCYVNAARSSGPLDQQYA
ncbi:hypothetical protein D3C71_1694810 [compost metagenome]